MADIERISDEADPDRCQAVRKTQGQCINKAAPGSEYCLAHGGNRGQMKQDAISLRNYRLTKVFARAQSLGENKNVKSLRDEIGVLRMMLEVKLNQCKDQYELILQSAPIENLIVKIDKLVNSCHKLEGSMGELLDKSAILQFASSVITIIGSELGDLENSEELINRIADKILDTLKDEDDA